MLAVRLFFAGDVARVELAEVFIVLATIILAWSGVGLAVHCQPASLRELACEALLAGQPTSPLLQDWPG